MRFDFSGNGSVRGGAPRPWWPDAKGKLDDTPGVTSGEAMISTAQAVAHSPTEELRQDLNMLYG